MLEKSERQALTKAFCQLRGWLQTSKIPIKTDGYRIFATNTVGQTVELRFGKADPNCVDINALNHRKLSIAVGEFHRITQMLGYNCPSPLRAGPDSKRASYHNDFDFVVFRHKEFRRVTNPKPEQLRKYQPTQNWALNQFWRTNAYKCQAASLEKSDLQQYLMVWTCNYIGLYEVQDGPKDENPKRLKAYLSQRLTQLMRVSQKKNKMNLNDSYALQELYAQKD